MLISLFVSRIVRKHVIHCIYICWHVSVNNLTPCSSKVNAPIHPDWGLKTERRSKGITSIPRKRSQICVKDIFNGEIKAWKNIDDKLNNKHSLGGIWTKWPFLREDHSRIVQIHWLSWFKDLMSVWSLIRLFYLHVIPAST